jgi:hypothetical protein
MNSTTCTQNEAEAIRDDQLFERHALVLAVVAGVVTAFWVSGLFADFRVGIASGVLITTAYYLLWRENGLHHRVIRRRLDRERDVVLLED